MIRNDATDVAGVQNLAPTAIVLSPGPCTPREAGCSLDVVRQLWRQTPMLGVCLGHQTIAAAFGAKIARAPLPMHGRTTEVRHDERGIYRGIPSPFSVCRYHSLVVDPLSLPVELRVTSRTADGIIMGLEHREMPIVGVQFHPESILTEYGFPLLRNFLELAKIVPKKLVATAPERLPCPSPAIRLPSTPVTF